MRAAAMFATRRIGTHKLRVALLPLLESAEFRRDLDVDGLENSAATNFFVTFPGGVSSGGRCEPCQE